MTDAPIYMDHHATTPVDERVVQAMMPYFMEVYGNPHSVSHAFGWDAKAAVDEARETIAAAFNAQAKEIVFTSGATESNNLAIRGVAERARRRGNHLISVRTEHKAVLDPLARLGRRGFEVTLLDVEPAASPTSGLLDVQQLAGAMRDDTLLVSVMLANNEIGVLQPIAEIGRLCKEREVLFHCDATQAVGKLPVDVEKLGIDLMSFSGHKMYGPKGVGGLYVRRRAPHVRLDPQIAGGGHEGGVRSGTLNVPGIVGLAEALKISLEAMEAEGFRLATLRDRLFEQLTAKLSDVRLNGPALDRPELRLPGNLNVSFEYVDGEALLMSIGSLAVSSGAACTSANPEPSHVLRALGLNDDLTRSSLRFGLGRHNTVEEVDRAAEMVVEAVDRLRRMSSLAP